MAETIEMTFGFWTRVGTRNHVLDVAPDRPKRTGIFRGQWKLSRNVDLSLWAVIN